MTADLFSVPIFFIVFRETLEAAIIVSVLLSLVEQLVQKSSSPQTTTASLSVDEKKGPQDDATVAVNDAADTEAQAGWEKTLIRRLRIQIFAGAATGFLIALSIGAAFIAVWFTKATDLWGTAEDLWEGIFDLIASIIIFIMGVTMLRMDRAKTKWRIKLLRSFEGKAVDGRTKSGRWVLFVLPLITVLREGMEAVVFVGGVSLGQPATAIPIAAICGLLCGIVCGYLIYAFASRTTLAVFLIVITNFLLLIGAGLFSKAVGSFESHAFNVLVGFDTDGAGDGPGSYNVQGNVWHVNCCNPENNLDGNGWGIFGAIFGWTNNGTLGTILSYIFYWLAVIAVLIYMKFKEGRTKVLGRESAQGARRRVARERRQTSDTMAEKGQTTPDSEEPVAQLHSDAITPA